MIPFYSGLPAQFLRKCFIAASESKGRLWPISYRTAGRIVGGEEWKPCGPPGYYDHMFLIQEIASQIWDREQGSWMVALRSHVVRRFVGDDFLRLSAKDTPMAVARWSPLGVDPEGHTWFLMTWSFNIMLCCDLSEGPKVTIKRVKVIRGRLVELHWDAPTETEGVYYRLSPDMDWKRIKGKSPYLWSERQSGKRDVTLTIRALNSVGTFGPEASTKIQLDVQYPDTCWKKQGPLKAINDLVWSLPVKPVLARKEAPHRIEYKKEGWTQWIPWTEKLREQIILALSHNGKDVILSFRTVSDRVYADPTPLTTKVHVEFNLHEAIQRCVTSIEKGNQDQEQAMKILMAIPSHSKKALDSRLNGIRVKIDALKANKKNVPDELLQAESRLDRVLKSIEEWIRRSMFGTRG
jgi:hypothetical protein